MIGFISDHDRYFQETLNTLEFCIKFYQTFNTEYDLETVKTSEDEEEEEEASAPLTENRQETSFPNQSEKPEVLNIDTSPCVTPIKSAFSKGVNSP